MAKGNKYGAKKTVVDGITFSSQAEARRYGQLKVLLLAGEIRDLVMQPQWKVVDAATLDGRRRPARVYRADFAYYTRDGERVVEDVKGGNATRTAVYTLKRQLVKVLYDIEVREVHA